MTLAETYRRNAHAQRALASASNLANRKMMHEQSAATWDAMAVNAEETAILATANAAAKAAA